jgi:predicted phosphodiesterase
MKCPQCSSENTTKYGIRDGLQRFRCKDCSAVYQEDGGDDLKLEMLRKRVKEVDKQLLKEKGLRERDNRAFNLLQKTLNAKTKPPKWLQPKKSKSDVAIATAVLSDTHFDEVVFPEQINFVNAYNRDIATNRLKTYFDNVIRLSRDHMSGVEIQGLVQVLGGDMVSGNIHQELASTNDAPIMDTVIYWSEQLIAGIQMLANEFDKVHIPAVTGNHGRNTQKPIAKNRARDNFDYLIYKLIEKHFRNESQITFDVSEGTDARWNVYNTRYQASHGDQFRGGTGIAGILSPILLGDHRKRQREQATDTPYDILILGHWHQLKDLGKVVINGSLKGYDEFSARCNFGFEAPQQAFWLTDPKHGKTITAPIHCYADNEDWDQRPEIFEV